MKWLIDKEIKGFNAQLDVEIIAIPDFGRGE